MFKNGFEQAAVRAAEELQRQTRLRKAAQQSSQNHCSLRLVPPRAVTRPFIERDSQIVPLWGGGGKHHRVHSGARRSSKLLSQWDLSHGASGAAKPKHEYTLWSLGRTPTQRRLRRGSTRGCKVAANAGWNKYINKVTHFLKKKQQQQSFRQQHISGSSQCFARHAGSEVLDGL